MTRVAILGSTGSIGTSALAVVETHAERLRVVALAAGNNVEALAAQVRQHRPSRVAVATPAGLETLRRSCDLPATAGAGPEALIDVATCPEADVVLCASSGTAALEAVLAAIEHGKTIALANKEVLVMAGGLVMEAARRHGVAVLPVDSEHNAIHQCLHGRAPAEVRRLILTASGGPFRGRRRDSLTGVTAAEALRHPTWRMGPKITIDSATLMNKGLEVIEAHWLFGVAASRIDVVVHPQSIVHSMVELMDGSVIAQMGITDMRLAHPRLLLPRPLGRARSFLDLTRMGALEFEAPAWDDSPLPAARLSRPRGRSQPADRAECGQRGRRRVFPGRAPGVHRHPGRHRPRHGRPPAAPAETLAEVRRIDAWARAAAEAGVRSYNRPEGNTA